MQIIGMYIDSVNYGKLYSYSSKVKSRFKMFVLFRGQPEYYLGTITNSELRDHSCEYLRNYVMLGIKN